MIILLTLLMTPSVYAQKNELKAATQGNSVDVIRVSFDKYVTLFDIEKWCYKNGYSILGHVPSRKQELKFGKPVKDGIASVTIQDTETYNRIVAIQKQERARREKIRKNWKYAVGIGLGYIGYKVLKSSLASAGSDSGPVVLEDDQGCKVKASEWKMNCSICDDSHTQTFSCDGLYGYKEFTIRRESEDGIYYFTKNSSVFDDKHTSYEAAVKKISRKIKSECGCEQ